MGKKEGGGTPAEIIFKHIVGEEDGPLVDSLRVNALGARKFKSQRHCTNTKS